MEIIKQLNLNGNPQTVPNGSLVYAKNIKISPDGTYITNDDGFNSAFIETEPDISNLKVSNVRTSISDGESDISLFYSSIPLKENTEHVTYVEQKIAGYINCPNEVVLFVYKKFYSRGEPFSSTEIYRAVEIKNSNKLALYYVPSAWQCYGGNIVGTYIYNAYNELIIAIGESDGEKDKQLVTINLNKCTTDDSEDSYSCAPNVPIANLSLIGKVKGSAMQRGIYKFFIRYEISDKLYTAWIPIGAPQYALSLDYKTLFNHIYATDAAGGNTRLTTGSILVNTDKQSYYNFNFNISFDNNYSYIGFQIGYILQTEDTSVGRIWNSFTFNKDLSKNFLFNGGFIEEEDIENFTSNIFNVYNVKALTSYNSRLYIGNFKETEYNVDLSSYAANINTYLIRKIVDTANIQQSSTIVTTWTYTIDGTSVSINVNQGESSVRLVDFNNLLVLLNTKIDWYHGADHNVLTYLGPDTRVEFSNNKLILRPSYNEPFYIQDYECYRFWEQNNYYLFGCFIGGGPGGVGKTAYGKLSTNLVSITSQESPKNYASYSTDNIIRSLMPYEVYAFYVHYVRPDGSYTNGIPLENKVTVDETVMYKKIGDLTSEEKATYGLTDISTIEEIADKYVYELAIIDNSYEKSYFHIYLDNNGKKLFRTGSGTVTISGTTYITRLGVRFENITYPSGYVGAFFSYEKLNPLSVYQGYVSDKISNNSSILLKANDVEISAARYDGSVFIAHHKMSGGNIAGLTTEPKYAYINNSAPVLSNASITFEGSMLNRIGTHGGVAMNLSKDDNTLQQYEPGIVGSIILFNKSIYNNEVKELIPFGPVAIANINYTPNTVYGENSTVEVNSSSPSPSDTIINYDMNYPSFLSQDNVLTYKEHLSVNEKGSLNVITDNVIDVDTYYDQNQYADITKVWKFSNINLLAISIKKEPEEIGGVVDNDDNTINILVKPINASDLFKIESCYLTQIHKSYTNYNKYLGKSNTFRNVIRASYPIRNESIVNSWRLLDPLAYYVINNAHGDIVNLFGASSSFFIHTKNNLLVTTSNAKLSADNVEINIVDNKIFDVEPKEIFSSELGYGGLKHRVCHLFSQFGYIWYDTERYKLFRYDNGQLIDMTSGISEIIRKYRYEYCFINIDNDNNRLIFSFVRDDKTLTMSYETLTGKWISIHDYVFDKSMHTANIAIFSHADKDNDTTNNIIKVMAYDKSADKADYKNLYVPTPDLPNYGMTSSIGKYCCFDIIFNPEYMTPKVLDSISWAHEIIQENTLDSNHPAELKNIFTDGINDKLNDLNYLYILIYTDAVDSGLLHVKGNQSKINDVTDPNSYKYPYYDKGVWNFNYFRNNIVEPATEEDITALCTKYKIDEDSPYFTKLKNAYKVMDRNNEPIYRVSDMNSLIYGKYIVVRFAFVATASSRKLKFDNLQVKLKGYK